MGIAIGKLSLFGDIKMGKLSCCGKKEEDDEPDFSVTDLEETLGHVITLVDNDRINFDSLFPSHTEYIYMKIVSDEKIVSVSGDLFDDFGLAPEDLLDKNICSIEKNAELFGEFMCPLFRRSIKTGMAFQFCFSLDNEKRLFCCSIYPCPIPGMISSVDCVIRPISRGFKVSDIDRFILPDDENEEEKGQAVSALKTTADI